MVKQVIFGALYYGLAQWLPASRRMGGLPGWLRYHCCRNIFASCGKGVNIERRVYFGSGSTIRVGDGSGIGVAAKLAPCVTIGRNVLMGEDVLSAAVVPTGTRVCAPPPAGCARTRARV